MDDNYLLIVEGSKTEPNIFSSVLTKYGFNVIVSNKKIDTGYGIELDYSNFKNNQKNVLIMLKHANNINNFIYHLIFRHVELYYQLVLKLIYYNNLISYFY